MKTKSHLDPALSEESSLVIDPETLTQWVDKTLPVPLLKSTDSLSEKFECLRSYKKESEILSSLLKEHFSPEIEAPAHTVCKVMAFLEEEEPQKNADSSVKKPFSALESSILAGKEVLSSVLTETEDTQKLAHPFLINLEELKPKRKTPFYLFPLAALLLLSGIMTSILLLDEKRDSEALAQQKEQKNSSAAKDKKNSSLHSSSRARAMDTSLEREALAPLSQSILTSGTAPTDELLTEEKEQNEQKDKKDSSPTEEILETPKPEIPKNDTAAPDSPPKEIPQGVEV